jgi:hypothetical protein
MEPFVSTKSIVRKIWGKSDTILFIFAGASAEFALNKAVDWLYFTGKLPKDPLGRLFSTVSYARWIVFSSQEEAIKAIEKISSIHTAVESARGFKIPDWAYRDVLFMLIHYSIASYELLERKLTEEEKEEVYNVFYRVGAGMNIPGLPQSYKAWLPVRAQHMEQDLQKSHYTVDLYRQYHRHLGPFRYALLKEAQVLVVPARVRALLQFRSVSLLLPVIPAYKLSRLLALDRVLKAAILPREYHDQIKALDQPGK